MIEVVSYFSFRILDYLHSYNFSFSEKVKTWEKLWLKISSGCNCAISYLLKSNSYLNTIN
ncbi:hypothetical protein BpHYR1_018704 [Brachionus plicatilis]|uniref:Uncharacterized protein n=1 Tax=Brachionus plicatilis TaxID=10195 RepID=A0A3M7Q3E0_BRAPC|nr:hypothetical protein BpHYR1_018704 [Brachionus plicatilis]